MINKADIHCHILYGVDDGSAGLEESIKLLQMEEAEGVTDIMLTPHLRHHMFETPDDEIIKRFRILDNERKAAGINIRLGLSREYHYDKGLAAALKEKRIILMNNRTMLLEFSHDTPYQHMEKAVVQLAGIGICAMIAHIERYEAIQNNVSLASELAARNALIQINAASILGDEGSRQKKTVKELMKRDLVFAVGSDAHDPFVRKPDLARCEKYLTKKYGETYTRKVMYDNPVQLIP